MSKRLVVLVVAPLVLVGGASLASATTTAGSTHGTSHTICIGVTSDPSSSGRDGICVRTDPFI